MNLFLTIVLDGLIQASWLFIVALGLTLVFGVLKILNIAHGGFYALGAYLAGSTRLLAPVEALGRPLWTRIQPLARRFLPARSPAQALGVGLMWGFLPCGLVYSMLGLALLSGSPSSGALIMVAFGLGTLPNLLLAGMLLTRLRGLTRHPMLRRAAGLLVLGFGVAGLARASTLGDGLWNGLICHT